jgi:hypothetical protein
MSRVLVFASIAALSICPEGMRRKGLTRLERALCFGDIGMAPASRFRAITLIRKQRMSGLGQDVLGWLIVGFVAAFILY